ncbi:hypothetical protein AB6A23_05115 [Paenibacillus tarimensis]
MKRLRELEYKAQSAISPAEVTFYEKEIKLIIELGIERAENKQKRLALLPGQQGFV